MAAARWRMHVPAVRAGRPAVVAARNMLNGLVAAHGGGAVAAAARDTH